MTNSVMDLYTYLALAGTVYCMVMFGWVLINLRKWSKQTRSNDEY